MKKLKNTLLLFIVLGLGASCDQEFLDHEATDAIAEEEIFKDPALMELFVNNMYLDVPSFDFTLYDNITDESRSFWGGDPRNVIVGQWLPDANPMEYWPYGAIRKTNMFLTKVDETSIDDAQKATYKGQVKFLRALHYFKMIKRYGGVPIITEPQEITDDLFVKRETLDASFQFVIAELEEAVELLPETYGSMAIDVGKPNKYSAKAFLGRVLLFYASSLYNESNDETRWETAAAINEEVINAGVYNLHDSFRNIMLDKNNEEEIFSVQFQKPFRQHGWDSWHQPDSRSKESAVSRSPVQEFVDAFEMENGKAITNPESGYDPANPYLNRDPRFYETLIINGSTFGFQGLPVYMHVESPIDGINNPYATISGYLMRKGTDESNQDYFGHTGSDQNWIELRFAEVLLNYAEAQNEASGPDESVYDAVERIRERAGLNPYELPEGLGRQEMREVIRHERYIELAFEQKRYWDLRRWKTAMEKLDGKFFHAMYITPQPDGSYSYEKKPLTQGPYVFQEKMYFMPIPQREIEKNPNLEQNSGW